MAPSKTWRCFTKANTNTTLSDLRRQSSGSSDNATTATMMILSIVKNLSTGQRPTTAPPTRPLTTPLTRSSSSGASRNNSSRDDYCAPLSPYSENPQQKLFATKNRRCIRKFILVAFILTVVQLSSHLFWAVGSHLGGYSVVEIDEYLQGQYRAHHLRPWLWNDGGNSNNNMRRHPRRHYDHRQFWGRRSKAEEDKMRDEEDGQNPSASLLQGRGREWTLNVKEGTISPKHASQLLLGVSLEKALVLVKRGTEQQLFFPQLVDLREGRRLTANLMAKTDEKEVTVGRKYGHDKNLAGPWRFDEAVVHPHRRSSDKPQPEAVKVSYAHHNFIRLERTDANDRDENLVLEVANWQVEDGAPLNFVGGTHLPTSPTYIRGRPGHPKTSKHHHNRAGVSGRDWNINDDGTLSPKSDPTLVVGVGRPRVVLVSRKNQAYMDSALIFDSLEDLAATSGDISSSGVPLTLRGRPEYALGKLRRHAAWVGPWRYVEGSFEHVDEAPRFRFVDDKFLYVNDDSDKNDSSDAQTHRLWSMDYGHLLPDQHQKQQKQKQPHHYTLDVAFWNLEEGSTVNLVGTSSTTTSASSSPPNNPLAWSTVKKSSSATRQDPDNMEKASSQSKSKIENGKSSSWASTLGYGIAPENKDEDQEVDEQEKEEEEEEDVIETDDDDDVDDDDEWMREEDGGEKGAFDLASSTDSEADDNSEQSQGETAQVEKRKDEVEDETAFTESTVAWNVSATGFVDYASNEGPSSLTKASSGGGETIVWDGFDSTPLNSDHASEEVFVETSSSGKGEDVDPGLESSDLILPESSNQNLDTVRTRSAHSTADNATDKNNSSSDLASGSGDDNGNLKLSTAIMSTPK